MRAPEWFYLTTPIGSRRAIVIDIMEPSGICILVGGGTAMAFGHFLVLAALVPDEVEFPDNALSLSLSLSFALSFLELGLGDGLAASSSCHSRTSFSPLSPSSKLKILPKFSPTFGEHLNKLTSSAGISVASISPVEVRTIPFIAEGIESIFMRHEMGVSVEAL